MPNSSAKEWSVWVILRVVVAMAKLKATAQR